MTSYRGKSERLGKSNPMQSVNLLFSKFWHPRKLVYFLTWYTHDRCSRSPALQENLSEVHFQLASLLSQEFQKARGEYLLLGWPPSEDQWGVWPGSWTCCFAELNYPTFWSWPWQCPTLVPPMREWSVSSPILNLVWSCNLLWQKKMVEVVSQWGLKWNVVVLVWNVPHRRTD